MLDDGSLGEAAHPQVPEELRDKLNQAWHENRKPVNAWK